MVASVKTRRPKPISRGERLRQGKVIRCWTLQEETYLLQSREQKLPYKHIATQLRKTELACRLHYHHMTVGRKGPSVDGSEDDGHDFCRTVSPDLLNIDPPAPMLHDHSPRSVVPLSNLSPPATGTSRCPPLPGFESLLDITYHRRSLSLPEFASNVSITPSNLGSREVLSSSGHREVCASPSPNKWPRSFAENGGRPPFSARANPPGWAQALPPLSFQSVPSGSSFGYKDASTVRRRSASSIACPSLSLSPCLSTSTSPSTPYTSPIHTPTTATARCSVSALLNDANDEN